MSTIAVDSPEHFASSDRPLQSADAMALEQSALSVLQGMEGAADSAPRPPTGSNRSSGLPKSTKWLVDGFLWYTLQQLRSAFQVFAIDDHEANFDSQDLSPMIIYCNHPGWWDPIVAMHARRVFFPKHTFYAPIEKTALEKYSIFKRLGFFGISSNDRNSAGVFLSTSSQILHGQGSSLWLTPEGHIRDARTHDAAWMPGLAHLVKRLPHVRCIPMAIEYPFLDEAKPFALCKFGQSMEGSEFRDVGKSECSRIMEHRLRVTQQSLSVDIQSRNFANFKVISSFDDRPRTIYDLSRWLYCLLTRRKFTARHGSYFTKT